MTKELLNSSKQSSCEQEQQLFDDLLTQLFKQYGLEHFKLGNSEQILNDYQEQIQQFLARQPIEGALQEMQMSLPSLTHYWISRWVQHRLIIEKLKKIRRQVIDLLAQKINQQVLNPLHKKQLKEIVEKQTHIRRIDDEIVAHELIIEYLSKVETVLRNTQFAFNNLTKIHVSEIS